jgi:murein DD-endopeptidase MepM/ murein hydrolase activator NlpD
MILRYDKRGNGDFGAPRGGRAHNGIDFSSYTGQSVKSPVTGKVLRISFPYANDLRYSGLLIQADTGEQVKIFYIQPGANIVKKRVQAGDEIGTAQDITLKYGQGMTNHIHVEITKNSVHMNPYQYFFTA